MGWFKVKRPLLAAGGIKVGNTTGSASTDERVVFVGNGLQSLVTTGSHTIDASPLTVITATDTGTYVLPTPEAGLRKRIVVDYVGATGNLRIVNPTTSIFFNGSTANILTVSSSEVHLNIDLWGLSATQWAAMTSTGAGVTFAGSTVKTS